MNVNPIIVISIKGLLQKENVLIVKSTLERWIKLLVIQINVEQTKSFYQMGIAKPVRLIPGRLINLNVKQTHANPTRYLWPMEFVVHRNLSLVQTINVNNAQNLLIQTNKS